MIRRASKKQVLSRLFRPLTQRKRPQEFFGLPTNPERRALACPVCHVIFTEKDFVRHACDPVAILRYLRC